MARKPSDTSEILNRISFWKGQYQIRNPQYIALDSEFEKICNSFDDDYFYSTDEKEDYEDLPPELKALAIRGREIEQEIEEKYKFAAKTKLIDPIEIYIAESRGEFPPKVSWEYKKSFSVDFIPTAKVSSNPDNTNKNILHFAVDCTEPTISILNEIRQQIDSYKEWLKNPDPDHIFEKDPSLPRHEELLMECLKIEVEHGLGGFQVRGTTNKPRAIGLMAFDRIVALAPPSVEPQDVFGWAEIALDKRALKKAVFDWVYEKLLALGYYPPVGEGDKKYNKWYDHLTNAQKCIIAGEVL